jgi:carbon monoxide dehydrogenase subunit G
MRGFRGRPRSVSPYPGAMGHRVERVFETSCPRARAFDYVADFSRAAEWDPGIPSGRRLDEGPVGVGSRFELRSRFGSTEQTIVYRVTRHDPPDRVTFEGEGGRFRGTDEITFAERDGGGTVVTYVADLALRGLASVALPFIRGRLDEMSDRAVAGLRAALDATA